MNDALMVWTPDGKTRAVSSIASNEAHVGNGVAEGATAEADYWPEVVRLYRGQLAAMSRRAQEYMDRAVKAEAQLAERSRAAGGSDA